jgi:hypothetical protein
MLALLAVLLVLIGAVLAVYAAVKTIRAFSRKPGWGALASPLLAGCILSAAGILLCREVRHELAFGNIGMVVAMLGWLFLGTIPFGLLISFRPQGKWGRPKLGEMAALACFAACFLLLIATGRWMQREVFDAPALNTFKPFLSSYVDTSRFASNSMPAYLCGKVLPVSKRAAPGEKAVKTVFEKASLFPHETTRGTGGVDRVYFELPKALRPTSPPDVGTVALLDWHSDFEGIYVPRYATSASLSGKEQPSLTLYSINCTVTIVDLSKKLVVAVKEIEGEHPAKEGKEIGVPSIEYYGPMPEEAVLKYIKSLPQADCKTSSPKQL